MPQIVFERAVIFRSFLAPENGNAGLIFSTNLVIGIVLIISKLMETCSRRLNAARVQMTFEFSGMHNGDTELK
jgi:hypothetical protein